MYLTYSDLENRYKKNRRTIWRWWAKDKTLSPPKRAGKVLLGWTAEQLAHFENGEV
ncbi:AlpA family transcriptional regulator [Psychromonas sp. Urea-02u-13]|uniref:AlpA family transcriptional regulator n=1 Tax=Psychromonas sp. Urea-02u-13 TaxID=2058326 RepID=UPI000C326B4B|nr:AlpA family transcriptional regulator [Psychromonas sp. Urea-02u-13]PKG37640.1 AlpA family transcriptional regulator [Psychromonas sp. Urea-02u-13]